MADIKFSEFPKATISKDSDEIAILQDGVNKMIASPVLESKIINKTVSRVIDQGGASLNLINPIGVVPTYADLATITPTPELNDAYQVEADGLVYVYTDSGFQVEGEGFVVQPEPIGVVEEDNPNAVSGGEVYKKSVLKSEIINFNFIDNIVEGAVNSVGVLNNLENTLSVWLLPINELKVINVGGFVAGVTKNLRFYDSFKNPIGSNYTLGTLPFSMEAPLGTRFVSFTIKSVSDTTPTNPFIYYTVDDYSLIDKKYLSENAVLKNEIQELDLTELNEPFQLFDKNTMVVNGRAINSTGNSVVQESAGHTDFIKIKPNSSIYIRKVLGSPSAGAWYDDNKNFISYLTMTSGNGFLNSPSNAVYLRLNLYNSSTVDVQANLDAFMVSISDKPVDYLPYQKYLGELNDFKVFIKEDSESDYNLEISDYLLPMSNYNYKKTLINNGETNTLINIGLFGDSWTDHVPSAIYYVKDLTEILREKYGFGGAGWYDFSMSQGDGTSQKMACANNEDANDVRTGIVNYVDQTASALGINIAHPIFRNGSSLTLNLLKPHQNARIYYYGGASYGSFNYQVGSGDVNNIDTSLSSGLQFIDVVLNDVNESIYFTITGDVILFGVDLKRDYGVRVHKFGNRGLRAYNYAEVDRNNYIEWLESFDLDSSTLLIGTNDRTVGRTPYQFKEDLIYFKDLYFEALPFSELAYISPSNNKLVSPSFEMVDFSSKIKEVCLENDLTFINTIPLFGSSSKIVNKGTFYDDVHPTINGGVMIANYIQEKLFN